MSVAADMDGAPAVRPWVDAAAAQFPTVLDPENLLGRLLDYKIIPNGLFIGPDGVLAGKWIGFSVDNPECLAAVDAFREGRLEPFERSPAGPPGAPGVAPGPVEGAAALSGQARELYDTRVRLGAVLASLGKTEEAATEWQKALLMDPGNFVLRKQIWRLRYPERFGPTIDFDWQKEQLARDREEEASMYEQGCGPEGCILPERTR